MTEEKQETIDRLKQRAIEYCFEVYDTHTREDTLYMSTAITRVWKLGKRIFENGIYPKIITVYEPGIPCSHPGCKGHIKHPCEVCGRYAAGLAKGPKSE